MFLSLFFSFSPLFSADIPYDVHFTGVSNKEVLHALNSVSQLISLKDRPPSTTTALRRRTEADISNLIQALHSFAYFEATITPEVDISRTPAQVVLNIKPGPVYIFESFSVQPFVEEEEQTELFFSERDVTAFPYETLDIRTLGITLGRPALPKSILDAETHLLQTMAKRGYPFVKIRKREVVADQAKKTVSVIFFVDSGPIAYFGEPIIQGQEKVSEVFLRKKIAWCPGNIYNPALVESTQEAIENSGLFSSVVITPHEALNEDGTLPFTIQVVESKHRTIGIGVNYTTQLGPGMTAEWENRNVRSLGEKLSFNTNIWSRRQTLNALYLQPDFLCRKQDLLWLVELEKEKNQSFTESFFSLSGIIDIQLSETTKFSYGATYKQLQASDSDNNRDFSLLKFPFHVRWSNANNLLNPTRGSSLSFKVTPTVEIAPLSIVYYVNNVTGTVYKPLNCNESIVLAVKATLGNILGASRRDIPPPERFYAGSENTLRGYRYFTVSPLNSSKKPIGGRSMMIYTIEPRIRLTETIGAVVFYEIGNVYSKMFPQFHMRQLQSAGFGLRYHTPVGPLRLDFAFPLNKRAGIDYNFEIYFSIGQAF